MAGNLRCWHQISTGHKQIALHSYSIVAGFPTRTGKPGKWEGIFQSGNFGFPLGLENLEKWEGIFQSGKSRGIFNRLEKSGKITQNTGKLREFEIYII